MSEDGHQADISESLDTRARLAARRTSRSGGLPQAVSKWVWIAGVVTTVASMAVLMMGQEPSAFNYLATVVLLGSMGALAFFSAARALNFGARYEESILYVEEMECSYRSLRQVVTTAMDLRDRVTGGHSDRVVELSLELGRGLGLPEERLYHLEWAAFLHDIGKVRVDEGILTKPGPLDASEWGEMQQHPFFSYSILMQVEALREAAEIVYCHHERFDGMGYPRSLRGTDIPLEARIFSVADAYDAMVSPRPYRQMMTHEDAVREIICHAGSQFDPQVVAVFARWAVTVSDGSAREKAGTEPDGVLLQRVAAALGDHP